MRLVLKQYRLAIGGGNTRARRPGRRTGFERGLDGGRDELRGLRVDDDVPAEQHAADDLLRENPPQTGQARRSRGGVP